MANRPHDPMWHVLGALFQSHPWHGVDPGPRCPAEITGFIEMVPTDTVKYELDKMSGLLRVDRPQRYSNVSPTLYGFIPQTLCGEMVGQRCSDKTGRPGIAGDEDPLDVCVLTERVIAHGNVLVDAIPIGGFRMIDGNEADDKIVAVLKGDPVYDRFTDITNCPSGLIDRLRHYFLTYKQAPDATRASCEISEIYDRAEAHEVIRRSREDYASRFAGLHDLVTEALRV